LGVGTGVRLGVGTGVFGVGVVVAVGVGTGADVGCGIVVGAAVGAAVGTGVTVGLTVGAADGAGLAAAAGVGAALDAGLAVVVDKPLASDAAAARMLVEYAEAVGGLLTVFQNRRWDGDFLTLRKVLDAGRLGAVLRFESRFDRWRPDGGGAWRETEAPSDGGGLLLDLGSHLADQAVQLFGPVARVYAELDVRRAGNAAEDDVFVALEHASGVRSHLAMSALVAQIPPRMRVLGDAGAFVKDGLDVQEAQLDAGMRPGEAGWGEDPQTRWAMLGSDADAEPVPTLPGAYERFYAGVAAALRDGTAAPVDPWDAVGVLEILDAARRSSAQARVVELG